MVLLLLVVSLWLPGLAEAQVVDPCVANPRSEACECFNDPHSEECVCYAASQPFNVPKEFEEVEQEPGIFVTVAKDVDGDGELPVFNTVLGMWEGDPDDMKVSDGADGYKKRCSLSYLRENLRRIWFFAVYLAAALTAVSLTWLGVVYMQESSSGGDLARSRAMFARVIIGVILVACVILVWDGVSGLLMSHLESWTLDREVFYRLD